MNIECRMSKFEIGHSTFDIDYSISLEQQSKHK